MTKTGKPKTPAVINGKDLIPPSFNIQDYSPAVQKRVKELADKLVGGEHTDLVKLFTECLNEVNQKSYQEGFQAGFDAARKTPVK